MKRIVQFSLLLMLVGKALAQQQEVQVDSSYANGYYVERLSFFRELPDRKKEIVFLGNSITEVGDWQELVRKENVVNRGISGDNSFGVYARLDEVLSSRPAKIFLMIGVNDLKRGTPVPYIVENYEKVAKRVKEESPGTMLYMQSVLPVTESVLAPIYVHITNEKIRVLNEHLQGIARKYTLPYVDLHNEVFTDRTGQMKRSLTTDGLHLKPMAYVLWTDYLKEHNYL